MVDVVVVLANEVKDNSSSKDNSKCFDVVLVRAKIMRREMRRMTRKSNSKFHFEI